MPLGFCPQYIGHKEQGRRAQCSAAGLDYDKASQFFTEATPTNFLPHYNSFVTAYPEAAKIISKERDDGVGPGEMITYLLYDNVTVGGKNAAYDVAVDEVPFAEFKGGVYTKWNNSIYDFKLHQDQSESAAYVAGNYNQRKIGELYKDGSIRDPFGKIITTCNDADFHIKVREIVASVQENTVDSNERVFCKWKEMVYAEYVEGKTFAFIRTDNLIMKHFGPITKDSIGLHRIHRNQPWARVFLPKQWS